MKVFFAVLLPILSASAADSLYFEPNLGQTSPEVQYLARARHSAAFITARGITLAPPAWPATQDPEIRLLASLPGAWMPGPRLDGSTSYRSGWRDKWVEEVPHYERTVKARVATVR